MIANVSYGYTAAGFSGRMPMAELADAIVQTGRATLERAIETIESDPHWNARVVYGDTDSLFVLLEGKSRAEAHVIGEEMSARITHQNPKPIMLKMEKVYLPCILQTKKRYVGFAYEKPTDIEPIFDAKGIETVRRDGCPIVAKTLTRTLHTLFTPPHDLSRVKDLVLKQCARIRAGRVRLDDFVFAKEVRLGTYAAQHVTQLPPAAIVAWKRLQQDPRSEPKYGERVPYVVVRGPPRSRLADVCVAPEVVLESRGAVTLHADYYIDKQILPALERMLSLVGADCVAWVRADEGNTVTGVAPRPWALQWTGVGVGVGVDDRNARTRARAGPTVGLVRGGTVTGTGTASTTVTATGRHTTRKQAHQGTLDRYVASGHCGVCDAPIRIGKRAGARAGLGPGSGRGGFEVEPALCGRCLRDPQASLIALTSRVADLEDEQMKLQRICLACGGGGAPRGRASAATWLGTETGTAARRTGTGTGFKVACVNLDCVGYPARVSVDDALMAARRVLHAGVAHLNHRYATDEI